MPQFIIDLKTLYKDLNIADKMLLTLVSLTFFSFPIGTAPPLILIITAFIISVISGKFWGIIRLWRGYNFLLKNQHQQKENRDNLSNNREELSNKLDIKSKPSITLLSIEWILPLLLFVALPWIGLLYVPEISDISMDYAKKTHYWLYAFVIAFLPFDRRVFAWIGKAFLAGLVINFLLAFLQFAGFAPVPSPSGIKGYFGFGVIYSALSIYLVTGILISSFFFKTAKTKLMKFVNIILIFMFIFHISIMDGRNGYVTFFILSPLAAINIIGRFEWKKILILCIIFLTCMSLSPVLKNRISSTFTNIRDNQQIIIHHTWSKQILDILPRFYLLKSAVDIFVDHPIIGAGTGGYHYYTGQNGGIPQSHPHGNILYMGVSFGILGLFSYFWLCWIMFKKSWKYRERLEGYFALSILLVIFISGFFNSQIIDSGPALFFALGYGFLNHLKEL